MKKGEGLAPLSLTSQTTSGLSSQGVARPQL